MTTSIVDIGSGLAAGDTIKTLKRELSDGTPLYGNGTHEIPMDSKFSSVLQTWVEGTEIDAPLVNSVQVNKVNLQLDSGDHTNLFSAFEAVTLPNTDDDGNPIDDSPDNAVYLWQGSGQDWRFHNYRLSVEDQLILSSNNWDPNLCDMAINGTRSMVLNHTNSTTFNLYVVDMSGAELGSYHSRSYTDGFDRYMMAMSANGLHGIMYHIQSNGTVNGYVYNENQGYAINPKGSFSNSDLYNFNSISFGDNKSIYVSDDGLMILVVNGAGKVFRNDLNGGWQVTTEVTEISNAKLIDPQTGYILVDAGDVLEMRNHLNELQETIKKPVIHNPKYQLRTESYPGMEFINHDASIYKWFCKRGRYLIGQVRFGNVRHNNPGSSSASTHYVHQPFTYDTVTGEVFIRTQISGSNSYFYGGFLLPFKNGGKKSVAEGEPMLWFNNGYIYGNAKATGKLYPLNPSSYVKKLVYSEEMSLGKLVGDK